VIAQVHRWRVELARRAGRALQHVDQQVADGAGAGVDRRAVVGKVEVAAAGIDRSVLTSMLMLFRLSWMMLLRSATSVGALEPLDAMKTPVLRLPAIVLLIRRARAARPRTVTPKLLSKIKLLNTSTSGARTRIPASSAPVRTKPSMVTKAESISTAKLSPPPASRITSPGGSPVRAPLGSAISCSGWSAVPSIKSTSMSPG
jgi:hypothetical protein